MIGINYDIDDPSFPPTFHRLWEGKGRNVNELFAKCLEGTRQAEEKHDLQVEYWLTDTTDEPMMSLWYQANLGSPPLVLTCAPFVEKSNTANFFMQEIDKFLYPTKQLFLGKESPLKGYLTSIPQNEMANIATYSPVAALAYVMASLHQWLDLEFAKKPKTQAQRIFDEVERGGQDGGDGLPWLMFEDGDEGGFFP